jgi:hypothetical protein
MKRTMVVAAVGFGALLAAGLAHSQAVQVCAEFDEHGKAKIDDTLFAGKASTTSTDLTGFCMSLVGPGLGQTGPTVFSIRTTPDDVSGSCVGTGPDATEINVTCDDGVETKLKGRVK